MKAIKKEILIKGLLIPLIIGLLLSITFLCFTDSSIFSPVSRNATIAYHNDEKGAKPIGTLSFDKTSLNLYEKAGYSDFVHGASVEQGSGIGEIGCSYIKLFQNNAKTLLNRDITVTLKDLEHYYSYDSSFLADSEFSVLLNKPDMKKCIILYYQKSNGIGFSDKYEALVYKEVQ